MRTQSALPGISRRLLTLAEAAEYCRCTVAVFERACPVTPIALGDAIDRRLLRYDILALDEWIDMAGGRTTKSDNQDWLAKL
ncbi:hypothetical protein LRS73_17590 [Methylobacterium currus]|jgi:hypothetical protein|uniref:hypothetical protein n=1 Tax=Methylobacterium currus TaxID=2051553 RepID=UPI001E3D6625|nr:hypothetical protein [Methylobacterium currus]UHC14374.1 hypothetical protein LRS73_17590 [Methylobacterium currus]